MMMRSSRDEDYRYDRDRRGRDQRHSKSDHHQRDRRSPDYYSSDEEGYNGYYGYNDGYRGESGGGRERDTWPNEGRRYDRSRDRERSREPQRTREREWERRERDRGYHHHHHHRPQNSEQEQYDNYGGYENYDEYNEDYYGEDEECGDREGGGYQSNREEVPNNTLMIRGLPPHITENDIIIKLTESNLQAKDIRLMRRKETGASRGFAFVEFSNLNEAVHWKNATQGAVAFDQCKATLHFSIPKEAFGIDARGIVQKFDWTCYKCGVNNFKRREECFKCGTPREESDANETGDEVSPTPTNCLMFRNLSPDTTEEKLLTALGGLTALPIKSIRIPKDTVYNVSKCVCFVELHTTLEASQLCTLLGSIQPNFIIDDCPLTIGYAKRNVQSAQMNAGAVNAASVALAAAQWTNQSGGGEQTTPVALTPRAAATHSHQPVVYQGKESNSSKQTNLGNVLVNGVPYQKYPQPDSTTFQFDKTSGFYYDATTTLYYDPKSHYYYNSGTQKYLYWSEEYCTYLPAVDGDATGESGSMNKAGGEAAAGEKTKPQGKEKHDKVKIAKKIAKDMEKWAKTLNQKKDVATRGGPAAVAPAPTVDPVDELNSLIRPGPDTPSYSFETYSLLDSAKEQRMSVCDERIQYNTEITDDDHLLLDAGGILDREESKLIDWDKFLCLLCKRQFNGKAQLTKHQEISELHKTNLDVLKRSKLTEEQLIELEKKEGNYRDRARERRKKYAQPDNPEQTGGCMDRLHQKVGEKTHRRSSLGGSGGKMCSGGSVVGSTGGNIGSKMLRAMGWSDGEGLGKKKQGTAKPIEVSLRTELAGLGTGVSTPAGAAGESYKEAVRRSMHQRFNELSSQD